MRGEAVEPDCRGSGIEDVAAEVEVAQDAGARADEHQRVGIASGDMRHEFVDEEARDRYGAHLMCLRGAPHEPAPHLGGGLSDRESTTHQVDPPDAQRGQFAPPQAAVGQHEDDQAVWPGGIGECADLLVGQEPLVGVRELG